MYFFGVESENYFNNNGNAETRTHNNVHELTAINAGSLAYDLKGNLTSNSNGQTYTWDFENLMKSATVGADTANYEYDALRRRVKKSFLGASTVFVYDGWRCVAEYENGASASSPARDFVFGTYLDEPLMMVTAPAGAATKRYYHSDHLYSVYALTDAGGAVVERYRYEAYGKATVLTAGFVAKTDPNYSEYANPWTYTGQRLDAETSLHYYKNRYYSAALGRFANRDPIGYSGATQLYSYVDGSSLLFVDPLGLKKTHTVNWTVVIAWEAFKYHARTLGYTRDAMFQVYERWNMNHKIVFDCFEDHAGGEYGSADATMTGFHKLTISGGKLPPSIHNREGNLIPKTSEYTHKDERYTTVVSISTEFAGRIDCKQAGDACGIRVLLKGTVRASISGKDDPTGGGGSFGFDPKIKFGPLTIGSSDASAETPYGTFSWKWPEAAKKFPAGLDYDEASYHRVLDICCTKDENYKVTVREDLSWRTPDKFNDETNFSPPEDGHSWNGSK